MEGAGYVWNQVESAPRPELEALQVGRLRTMVRRVATDVPFYRDALEREGLSADDIGALDDLTRFPFTTKQDLRDHYPYGLFAKPMDEVVRIHASSGTTGKPTVVGYTQADVDLWAELMARTLASGGVTRADIVQNAYGYGLFTGGLGFHYGAETLGAAVIPISGGNTRRQLMLMQDFGSTALCCTPSYALLVAEEAEAEGIDVHGLPLKAGFFGAEPWSAQMKQEIEARLGILAIDCYGLSEIIGPGVAMECPEKAGLHINEDHFIAEVIDPDTGDPVDEGEYGELVLTCVTKEALPLLRYRTRDRTRLHRGACGCGRTTTRMEPVLGRTDDMIIVRGVNVFPSQIETVLLQVEGVTPHYQIVVDRAQAQMDELELMVEAMPETYHDAERVMTVERQLKNDTRTALGISCRVRIVGPREIQRSEGKAVRVVDKRRL